MGRAQDLTNAEIAAIKALMTLNLNASEIARRSGRSVNAVQKVMQGKEGGKRRGPKRKLTWRVRRAIVRKAKTG